MSKPARVPKALSQGESAFALHCRAEGLTPEREYIFSKRKFRFDFAFPDKKLAVEVEGGIWMNGRHNRASSIEMDFFKYNLATKLGWHILRYSTAMAIDGTAISDVLEMLGTDPR